MADIANRDEARRCIRIAEAAVRERDLAKAEKFLKKAKQLYSSEEIYKAALSIESIITDFSGGSSRPANGHTPHHEQPEPSRNHRSSGDTPSSSNAAGPKLPNRNTDHLRNRKQPEPEPDLGTPEQKALVQHILKAKDLYAVLDVQKTASDDDIKKAYRKLALKLHPDKNKARGAEEAFKSVSKAFTMLSDPDERAYYDRTGHESAQAHAAAAQQQRGAGGARYYQQEEIDPEEIFNMFFGGMFPGNARVFRTHYAGGHPHRRTHQQQHAQQQQQQQQADTSRQAIFGLLQFLPVLLLVLVTLFSGTQQPTYSLVRDRTFSSPLKTQRLEVEYYVKSESDFEKSYPRGSSARYRLERQVESTYYEELEGRCQHEKMMKQRAWAWGNRDQALAMKLESCEKMERMYEKINHRRSSYPR